MSITVPVTNRPPSPQSHAIASATSRPSPTVDSAWRPKWSPVSKRARSWSSVKPRSSDGMMPGRMQLTRIPSRPRSTASARLIASTAPLLAT